MNWTPWSVVRFGLGDGLYGLMRSESPLPARGRMPTLDYHLVNGRKWTTTSLTDAERKANRLNGRIAVPRRCPAREFERLTRHVRMRPRTRDALRDVLVRGVTWRTAAAANAVSESTIHYALRRVAAHNMEEPTCSNT